MYSNRALNLIIILLVSAIFFRIGASNYIIDRHTILSESNNKQIYFTENKGQLHDQNHNTRSDILYYGNSNDLLFYLKSNGISYQQIHSDSIRTSIYRIDVEWLNCDEQTKIIALNESKEYTNFYLPTCPNGALNVKSFNEIYYSNIYKGIDLKWYTFDGHLKYDYIVDKGADYKQIKLQYNGVEKMSLNENGELEIITPLGKIIEEAPILIQNNKVIKAEWKLSNNILEFNIGDEIDPNESYVIDPGVRVWGTYFGGSEPEVGYSCSVDSKGNVYMAGTTWSTSAVATTAAYQTSLAGDQDAFVAKFDSLGNLLWATYFGGSEYDYAYACTVDNVGNVFATGLTNSSSNIASSGSWQTTYIGGPNSGYYDAFLVKFDSSGNRLWATYYGDQGYDVGYSCSSDIYGNIYMGGETSSISNISSTNAWQTSPGSVKDTSDAFLVKFDANGNRIWATYYGGNMGDVGHACLSDMIGNIYLAGITVSTNNIASTGAWQASLNGYHIDAFLAKFDSLGNRIWATYYGGSENEVDWHSLSSDTNSNIYMSGSTQSTTDMASIGAWQTIYGGTQDAYLVKFDSSGNRLWGTYYGGSGSETGKSCSSDQNGNVFLVGDTWSASDIASSDSWQTSYGGNYDAYLVKFDSLGNRQWATYYGDQGIENGYSCSTDNFGNVYLAGITSSTLNIASTGAWQTTNGGPITGSYLGDAFLVKFRDSTSQSTSLNQALVSNVCSLVVFPNPTNGNLILESKSVSNVTIYNNMGKIVFTFQLNNGKNDLEIHYLPTGIYLFQYHSSETVKNIKVLKE